MSYDSNFHDVGMFHVKFGLDNVTQCHPSPRELNRQLMDFRVKFMQEELDEFIEGLGENDPVKMADALIDLVYVAMGTAHLSGYPWHQLWQEVHAANMRKIRPIHESQSRRDSRFDVVKPDGWKPPDVAGVLRQHGWDL